MTGKAEAGFFAHETAVIDDGATLGAGTKVWHFCHVMPGAVLGKDCSLGQNVFVANGVELGDNVKVQNNVSIYTGVQCEDDVFLGPSMVFTNVINPRSHVNRKEEFRRTLLERGASVGANATIVCGTTMGRYSFVGAGSVVTHDVPAYGLVYGVPARLKGYICRCGVGLEFATPIGSGPDETECLDCGARYLKDDAGIVRAAEE
jgi:UDP-2-acetamido-3-amino-2,3-dideoxy-glucuronate N-acetyltransferase